MFTLNQPPDQTKPTILHQVVIRSTTKPSTQRLSPGPINSKTQRSSRRSPTPKLVPFGPGKLSERPCTYRNPALHRVRGHQSEHKSEPPCTRIILGPWYIIFRLRQTTKEEPTPTPTRLQITSFYNKLQKRRVV